ncbi:MAG: type VI secretion system accessory protein TagJ [Kofleriaceae bacterium]
MTAEDRMQQGDFEGALGILVAQNAAQPDPGQLLMQFSLEVRLQRFAAADQTIRRIVQLAPEVAGPMQSFAANARAEAAATARMTDPSLAGRRAGIGMPPPHALAYVKAAVHHAQGDHAGVVAALAEAKPLTPATPGTFTWRSGRTARFASLVDSDDLTGPILPCYERDTVLDLAYTQLRSITFGEMKTSFDVMWIPAQIVPVEGNPMIVKVPAYHVGTGVAREASLRSGQMTMWNHDRGYAEAIGQRDFAMLTAEGGKSMVGILQVGKIEFDAVTATSASKPGFFKKLFGNN